MGGASYGKGLRKRDDGKTAGLSTRKYISRRRLGRHDAAAVRGFERKLSELEAKSVNEVIGTASTPVPTSLSEQRSMPSRSATA
jgi:hypothetical protein